MQVGVVKEGIANPGMQSGDNYWTMEKAGCIVPDQEQFQSADAVFACLRNCVSHMCVGLKSVIKGEDSMGGFGEGRGQHCVR